MHEIQAGHGNLPLARTRFRADTGCREKIRLRTALFLPRPFCRRSGPLQFLREALRLKAPARPALVHKKLPDNIVLKSIDIMGTKWGRICVCISGTAPSIGRSTEPALSRYRSGTQEASGPVAIRFPGGLSGSVPRLPVWLRRGGLESLFSRRAWLSRGSVSLKLASSRAPAAPGLRPEADIRTKSRKGGDEYVDVQSLP